MHVMKWTCSRKVCLVIVILDRVFFLGQIFWEVFWYLLVVVVVVSSILPITSIHPPPPQPSSHLSNYNHLSIMSETTTKTKTAVVETPPTFKEIMNKAGASAVRGGTAGAVAMGANVACLMWMRTTVRKKWRQHRYLVISMISDLWVTIPVYSSLTLVIFHFFSPFHFFSSISFLSSSVSTCISISISLGQLPIPYWSKLSDCP